MSGRLERCPLIVALWLGGFAACGPHPDGVRSDARRAVATTLARAAESTGRSFGVAIDPAKLSDPTYTAIAAREFDLATTATGMEPELTEPLQGVFDFTQGDQLVAWAAKNGMRVRGHKLVQFSRRLSGWWLNPSWISTTDAMLDHVEAIVTHYRGQVAYWDVVSEAFAADGTSNESWFWGTSGSWISSLFWAAHSADPTAKLCYDESDIESWGSPKTQAVFAMVRRFKAYGVPIDCVGIRGHFTSSNPVPSSLGTTIANFAALGVEVALTELDSTGAPSADYAAAIQACSAVPGCTGVSVSGVRDGDAPNPSDQPLLFDDAGEPKPAYAATLSAFGACGGGSCTPSYPLTISKAGAGTGTVTSNVGDLSCGTACTVTFPNGTGVILTATPAVRSVFTGWSGGGCSGTGICLVSMSAAQTVTATFDAPPTLQGAAEAKGRFFGTAVPWGRLAGDPILTAIANLQFDMISPENELWLDATEPQQNSFSFKSADSIVSWALQNGKRVKGGPVLTYSSQPSWLGSLSGANLRKAILNHVSTVVKYFQGRVAYWVVVTEAFSDGGDGGRRRSNFQQTGDDWIEAAFNTARAADPTAKLCYEDYNIENWTAAKTQGVYAMVKDFKSRGVPIDCVSLESHFTGGASVPANFQTTIESFAALGVEVHLGELDVTNASTSGYAAAVQACMAVSSCTGITVWGVRDSDSWRSSESPLLFDGKGQPKPAFYAVLDALNGVTAFPLTITKQGGSSGAVTSSPGGISCGTSCTSIFPGGSMVTLTATPSNAVFAGWGGACSGSSPTCTVSIDAAKTVTASFTPTFAVVVRKSGSGSGQIVSSPAGIDCGQACTARFINGRVDLTAIPDAGSEFMGWPDCPGSATCSVWISGQDAYVYPEFQLTAKPTLTVTKTGDGSGWVGSIPDGISCGSTCSAEYFYGAQVTLTAAGMDDSSIFAGWSGDCTGTGACTVSMSAARSVVASFKRGDASPPTTPQNLASTVIGTSITLTWTASTDNVGVAGYDVFNGTELAGSVAATSANISNLLPGATYIFAVRARDAAGNVSGRSEPVALTIPKVDVTPPSVPANLVWTSDGMTVTLSWGASSDDVGMMGYDLWYGNFFLGTFSDTAIALIGFKPGTRYTFTVKARDAAGNVSVASNEAAVLLSAPTDTTPPSAPTKLSATSSSATSVRLSWTASTDDVGVVVYQVYAGTTLVGTVAASTSATISSLSPSTTYVFTVTARDAAGNLSTASNAVSVTTSSR